MMRTHKKGFTLVELLVVIAIIGLLSTLAIVALNSARQRSRDAKRVSDVRQVQTALQLYFDGQNEYPFVAAPPVNLGEGTNAALTSNGFEATPTAGATVYMGLIPDYPTPGPASELDDYEYTAYDDNTEGSTCTTAGETCGWYKINFDLEDDTGSLKDGVDANSVPDCDANPDGITCL